MNDNNSLLQLDDIVLDAKLEEPRSIQSQSNRVKTETVTN